MVSLEEILVKLEKVTPNADGYMACCPAHNDKTPSLSVCERGGAIWIYCFAGCEKDTVLEAIGYTWKDLPQKALGAPSTRIKVPHNRECDEMFVECVKADVAAGKPIPEKDKRRYQAIIGRKRAA